MISGVVVALPEELRTLTSSKVEKGHCYRYSETILIAYAGAGPDNARKASDLLIAEGARQLISWGCAAALTSHLKAGDFVLAASIVTQDHQKLDADRNWHTHVRELLSDTLVIHTGTLAESTRIISASTEKRQLHANTAADALDMESAALADIAVQNKIPWLVIRTIVDPVDMDLPAIIDQSMNNEGEIIIPRLLLKLLQKPSEIPGLIRLGINFNAATKTLKSIARHLAKIAEFDSLKTEP